MKNLFTFILIIFSSQFLFAQEDSLSDQKLEEIAIKKVIENFVEAAGNYNFEAMEDLFADNSNIGGASLRSGKWHSFTMTLDEFINVLKTEENPRKYKESISKYTIHLDKGKLAFVKADATLFVDDKTERTNFDYFTLIKLEGVWKILNGSYVSVPFEE